MQPLSIILIVISCIFCIIAVLFFYFGKKKKNKIEDENRKIENDNLQIIKQNQYLKEKQDSIIEEITTLQNQKNELTQEIIEQNAQTTLLNSSISDKKLQEIELKTKIDGYTDEIARSRELASTSQEHWTDLARSAFITYCDQLDFSYQRKEGEYESKIAKLDIDFELRQNEIAEEILKVTAELDKIKNTRAAAVEAMVRDEEIKQKADFYCPKISKADIADIEILETIKPRLNNPRILSMLIWSTYYQKKMTTLCNNILGTETVCGIYKITNQLNNMCYIGQSVDLDKRWKDHAKCGLGVDTPQGNKLYAAMQKDGLYNFSFELLEKCSKEELNEKEKYYIELYQSKDYGYNTTGGNSK